MLHASCIPSKHVALHPSSCLHDTGHNALAVTHFQKGTFVGYVRAGKKWWSANNIGARGHAEIVICEWKIVIYGWKGFNSFQGPGLGQMIWRTLSLGLQKRHFARLEAGSHLIQSKWSEPLKSLLTALGVEFMLKICVEHLSVTYKSSFSKSLILFLQCQIPIRMSDAARLTRRPPYWMPLWSPLRLS